MQSFGLSDICRELAADSSLDVGLHEKLAASLTPDPAAENDGPVSSATAAGKAK